MFGIPFIFFFFSAQFSGIDALFLFSQSFHLYTTELWASGTICNKTSFFSFVVILYAVLLFYLVLIALMLRRCSVIHISICWGKCLLHFSNVRPSMLVRKCTFGLETDGMKSICCFFLCWSWKTANHIKSMNLWVENVSRHFCFVQTKYEKK